MCLKSKNGLIYTHKAKFLWNLKTAPGERRINLTSAVDQHAMPLCHCWGTVSKSGTHFGILSHFPCSMTAPVVNKYCHVHFLKKQLCKTIIWSNTFKKKRESCLLYYNTMWLLGIAFAKFINFDHTYMDSWKDILLTSLNNAQATYNKGSIPCHWNSLNTREQ